MNEEEIRGKVLLPFLHDLGIELSEISLEDTFTIRLGKSKHKNTGRSDILCKRNGKNLFIIELKNDFISIDQQDIDQGISYARLLSENIAPFTIITNGRTTRIFDSISREELTGKNISGLSSYFQNNYSLSLDVDLQIRYEALKNFVSFSSENLQKFCESQVRERMGPIIGNIDNPFAKFVKELYVQRKDLQNEFNAFVDSGCSTFAIVGSAGVGKTSAICSLALQKLETGFVFFYNAAIINKSPIEHIAQDLNGVFSSKIESESVLKKLDQLGIFINKTILIFIDAIDENIDSNLAIELSEIALAIRNLEKVKLCISCKSNIWNNILKKNGSPTHLYEELEKTHQKVQMLDNCPAYFLEDFTEDELQSVIPLYQKTFGFIGNISKPLLKALRNGFFLRIFSEVYGGKQIPHTISDKNLIRKYLLQSLERTKIGSEVGLRILAKIGIIFNTHKYSSWDTFHDQGLEAQSLIDKLELSLDDRIPEDLFARNILVRSNKEDSYNISFYYSKIRDYIICYHSYRLDKLDDSQFYNSISVFYENHIGESAMSFYIQNLKDSHKPVLVQYKKDKALEYVESYNNYLDEHFEYFKDKFNPGTKGDIGLFLPIDLLKSDGYALFPMDLSPGNRIQYVQLGQAFAVSYDHSIFGQKGVKSIHASNKALLVGDQSKLLREDIVKQLKEILKKGRISIYNSDVILRELVSTIVYFYYKKLGYSYKIEDYNLPRFELIYPIDLEDLKSRLYKFRVTEYYYRQHLTPEQRLESIDRALREGSNIPPLNITGDFPPFEELYKIVEILMSRGYTVLKEHHLPTPDVSIQEIKTLAKTNNNIDQIRGLQFTEEQAERYIERFITLIDSCYREFVETCFPTLKANFPFFQSCPHEYFIYKREFDLRAWAELGYRSSQSGETVVNFKQFISSEDAFLSGETEILWAFPLTNSLHNDYYHIIKTIDKLNTDRLDEYCVLRNWVYRFLQEDLKFFFKQ
ncbi:MAG TPA: type I restriction enzyme HsdR N-terminal domain-containing protein [Chitinophagaceae bacterium]|nr:type I restriction enzyme HsdR N-terminal domain-containing protein [Chitinophagaceae bacterium]